MVTNKEFKDAERRGRAMWNVPHATAAIYIPSIKRILVELSDGLELALAPEKLQALEGAKASDLKKVELWAGGGTSCISQHWTKGCTCRMFCKVCLEREGGWNDRLR